MSSQLLLTGKNSLLLLLLLSSFCCLSFPVVAQSSSVIARPTTLIDQEWVSATTDVWWYSLETGIPDVMVEARATMIVTRSITTGLLINSWSNFKASEYQPVNLNITKPPSTGQRLFQMVRKTSSTGSFAYVQTLHADGNGWNETQITLPNPAYLPLGSVGGIIFFFQSNKILGFNPSENGGSVYIPTFSLKNEILPDKNLGVVSTKSTGTGKQYPDGTCFFYFRAQFSSNPSHVVILEITGTHVQVATACSWNDLQPSPYLTSYNDAVGEFAPWFQNSTNNGEKVYPVVFAFGGLVRSDNQLFMINATTTDCNAPIWRNGNTDYPVSTEISPGVLYYVSQSTWPNGPKFGYTFMNTSHPTLVFNSYGQTPSGSSGYKNSIVFVSMTNGSVLSATEITGSQSTKTGCHAYSTSIFQVGDNNFIFSVEGVLYNFFANGSQAWNYNYDSIFSSSSDIAKAGCATWRYINLNDEDYFISSANNQNLAVLSTAPKPTTPVPTPQPPPPTPVPTQATYSCQGQTIPTSGINERADWILIDDCVFTGTSIKFNLGLNPASVDQQVIITNSRFEEGLTLWNFVQNPQGPESVNITIANTIIKRWFYVRGSTLKTKSSSSGSGGSGIPTATFKGCTFGNFAWWISATNAQVTFSDLKFISGNWGSVSFAEAKSHSNAITGSTIIFEDVDEASFIIVRPKSASQSYFYFRRVTVENAILLGDHGFQPESSFSGCSLVCLENVTAGTRYSRGSVSQFIVESSANLPVLSMKRVSFPQYTVEGKNMKLYVSELNATNVTVQLSSSSTASEVWFDVQGNNPNDYHRTYDNAVGMRWGASVNLDFGSPSTIVHMLSVRNLYLWPQETSFPSSDRQLLIQNGSPKQVLIDNITAAIATFKDVHFDRHSNVSVTNVHILNSTTFWYLKKSDWLKNNKLTGFSILDSSGSSILNGSTSFTMKNVTSYGVDRGFYLGGGGGNINHQSTLFIENCTFGILNGTAGEGVDYKDRAAMVFAGNVHSDATSTICLRDVNLETSFPFTLPVSANHSAFNVNNMSAQPIASMTLIDASPTMGHSASSSKHPEENSTTCGIDGVSSLKTLTIDLMTMGSISTGEQCQVLNQAMLTPAPTPIPATPAPPTPSPPTPIPPTPVPPSVRCVGLQEQSTCQGDSACFWDTVTSSCNTACSLHDGNSNSSCIDRPYCHYLPGTQGCIINCSRLSVGSDECSSNNLCEVDRLGTGCQMKCKMLITLGNGPTTEGEKKSNCMSFSPDVCSWNDDSRLCETSCTALYGSDQPEGCYSDANCMWAGGKCTQTCSMNSKYMTNSASCGQAPSGICTWLNLGGGIPQSRCVASCQARYGPSNETTCAMAEPDWCQWTGTSCVNGCRFRADLQNCLQDSANCAWTNSRCVQKPPTTTITESTTTTTTAPPIIVTTTVPSTSTSMPATTSTTPAAGSTTTTTETSPVLSTTATDTPFSTMTTTAESTTVRATTPSSTTLTTTTTTSPLMSTTTMMVTGMSTTTTTSPDSTMVSSTTASPSPSQSSIATTSTITAPSSQQQSTTTVVAPSSTTTTTTTQETTAPSSSTTTVLTTSGSTRAQIQGFTATFQVGAASSPRTEEEFKAFIVSKMKNSGTSSGASPIASLTPADIEVTEFDAATGEVEFSFTGANAAGLTNEAESLTASQMGLLQKSPMTAAPAPAAADDDGDGLAAGALVGIVVALILVVALIVGVVIYSLRKSNSRGTGQQEEGGFNGHSLLGGENTVVMAGHPQQQQHQMEMHDL